MLVYQRVYSNKAEVFGRFVEMNQWKTFRPSGINAPCPIDIQLPCGWHSTHYPQKGGLSHTSHMYSICWWMKTMNSNRSLLFSGEQKGTWLLTHADLTPWALKWGIPKSPWVSILKWSSMTWMISGYPHGLGNLHIKLFLYIYIYISHYIPITIGIFPLYIIPIIYPLYGGFLKWRGTLNHLL